MKRITKVVVGQRFRSIGVTGKPTYAFEVQTTFRSSVDQREYVRLVEVADPTRTKTLALATITDPRHFVAIQPEGENQRPPSRGFGRAILDALR
ncbi:MAG TPA: hypothetical protein VGP50_16300 [Stellaceae bacterium]|jgi:hypothetical protein|nr:hypothetical protein [Stellaceae bacterium]